MSICYIGTFIGCMNDLKNDGELAGQNIEENVDSENKKEDKKEDKKDKDNIIIKEDEAEKNKKPVNNETDKTQEDGKENYYSKYDNFYNGTQSLSVDFKGEGIGDNFLDYTFKINGKGNLSVEIASLRGMFKGDIDAIPNTFRQWKGTVVCAAEQEKIDVEVKITEHALVIIETEGEIKQTTKFYYESKTFDLEHISETTYTKKGEFDLKKK